MSANDAVVDLPARAVDDHQPARVPRLGGMLGDQPARQLVVEVVGAHAVVLSFGPRRNAYPLCTKDGSREPSRASPKRARSTLTRAATTLARATPHRVGSFRRGTVRACAVLDTHV